MTVIAVGLVLGVSPHGPEPMAARMYSRQTVDSPTWSITTMASANTFPRHAPTAPEPRRARAVATGTFTITAPGASEHPLAIVAPGLCCCGCGQKTPLAKRSGRGLRQGQPTRYLPGHQLIRVDPLKGRYAVDTDTGCWVWSGAMGNGRGTVRHRGQIWRAHVLAYALVHGSVPPRGCVHATCRNPLCVNSDHLELITVRDVTRRTSRVKLTPDSVREIRTMVATLTTQRSVAAYFGVSESTVSRVLSRERWGTLIELRCDAT